MNKGKRRATIAVFAIAITSLLGAFALLIGSVPQTIIVDGSNDFLPANLVDNDSGDVQFAPLDLGNIYVTNDANKLYVGFEYDKDGWTNNQLGIMFATGGPSGGTNDAWGHAIGWTTAPRKPDYQAYCNMDNSWQELRKWTGTDWSNVLYQGSNSLGWVNNTGFEEVGFNLSDLGLAHGDTVYIELISTQNGSTKGPLDCMVNDGKQLSHLSGTTWDVGSPVELDSMYLYIVVAAGDTAHPTVSYATGSPDAAGAGSTNKIDLVFSEPVDKTTAEDKDNYALTGTAVAIDSVRRNPTLLNRVQIYLNGPIAQQAGFYEVAVTNVQDLVGNAIRDNGTTNVGCFFLQKVLFRGFMMYHLLQHSVPPNTFSVEGDLLPLTFVGTCDNAIMTDIGGGIYEAPVLFSLIGTGCGGGGGGASADTTLQWKFMHLCTEYEPLGSNRSSILSSSNGPIDTLAYYWNDEGPDRFIAHAIDVIFRVDVNAYSPGPDSVVAINGSVVPLDFSVPSITNMLDDGVYPDETAGDGIYSVKVRFRMNSYEDVGYKYLYNDLYECQTEGNRSLWLNDAAYDTVGSVMGPLVMPLQYYDRCSTVGRAVEVVFRVATLDVAPTDTIAVNGEPNNQLPPVISWDVPSINRMHDDGVYPDDTSGDGTYSASIVFPDSSSKYVEYKYLFNSTYECSTQPNRYFFIDDAFDAVGNPQILELDYFGSCVPTDVPHGVPAVPLTLHQNYPNPFNPITTISFMAPSAGRASLRVYNLNGALVRTLLDRVVAVGEVSVRWDGKDESGRTVSTGVYFYELRFGGDRVSRKMVLLR
jgi:hypothetical protein